MANATSQVPMYIVPPTETKMYYPLVGGAVAAKEYQTGQMMGIITSGGNKGFAKDMDDTAVIGFIGLLTTKSIQVLSTDANGARLALVELPYMFMTTAAATATYPDDFFPAKKAYAVDNQTVTLDAMVTTNDNLVGYTVHLARGENFNTMTGTKIILRSRQPGDT